MKNKLLVLVALFPVGPAVLLSTWFCGRGAPAPVPTPTPTATTTPAPPTPKTRCGLPPNLASAVYSPGVPDLWSNVTAAQEAVKLANLDRITDDDRLVGFDRMNPLPTRDWYFGEVVSMLQDQGLCAGWFQGDEISVGRTQCGDFEEYHLFEWGGGRILPALPNTTTCGYEETPAHPKCKGSYRGYLAPVGCRQ